MWQGSHVGQENDHMLKTTADVEGIKCNIAQAFLTPFKSGNFPYFQKLRKWKKKVSVCGIIPIPSLTFIKMCCQWDLYLSTRSVRPVGSSRRWLSSVSGWHKRKHGALCKQAYLLFVGQEIMLCDPGIIGPPAAAEKMCSLLAVSSLLSALCLSMSLSAPFPDSHVPVP